MTKLQTAIQHAINCASAENGSDTPDFILAEYLTDCLAAYDRALVAREKWYGRECGGLKGPIPVDGPPPPDSENVSDQIPRTQDVANTTDSPERLSASVLFASCDGLVAAMSRCDCIYVDTTGAGAVIADMAESAGIKITRFRRASGLPPRRHSDCVQHDQPSQSAKQYAQQP